MAEAYDVVVIGAGPAGYVAAIRCAQLGLKTACVDDWVNDAGKPSPGGTCLNVGCIPSKALLDTSKHYYQLRNDYAQHGIQAENVAIDIETMLARKNKIVKQLTGGIGQLFKANKIQHISGFGRLLAARKVEVTPTDGGEARTLEAEHVILASGSKPIELPGIAFDGERIVDNAGALALERVPERMAVIGAGVIGLELGSVWSRLGADTVLLEALPDFLAAADRDIARTCQREFKKQGLDIRLGAKVQSAEVDGDAVVVRYEDKNGEQSLTVDRLLVCVGRRPFTDGVLSEDCGVTLDDRGRIDVDDYCRTAAENVWAIGDVVRGPMLAHKGEEEGMHVAESIAGHPSKLNLDTVPWVIYTEPEIAWVGKTEQELKDEGREYRSGSFPFAANGRALGMNEPAGMAKVLADAETDTILGVHIAGANASELIAEAVVAMEFSGASEDIARIIHAHPTLSETVHEAALGVHKRAIHRAN